MSLKLLCRIQVNKGRNNIVNKISYQAFDLDTCKCNLRNSCFPENFGWYTNSIEVLTLSFLPIMYDIMYQILTLKKDTYTMFVQLFKSTQEILQHSTNFHIEI